MFAIESSDVGGRRVLFDGTKFVVAFHEAEEEEHIFARFVSTSGTVSDRIPIAVASGSQGSPAMAFDGESYLFVWTDEQSSADAVLKGRYFKTNGMPVGSDFLIMEPQGMKSVRFAHPLYAGGQFFVAAEVQEGTSDLYGLFLPRRDQPPRFLNPSLRSDGRIQVQLQGVLGQSYTIQNSPDLVNWTNVGNFIHLETNVVTAVDSRPVANFPRLFYRAILGISLAFDLFFQEFAQAGAFQGGVTPNTTFPVLLSGYTARFEVQHDTDYPSPESVFFTGPAGSGLSNTPASQSQIRPDEDSANYQSPVISDPAAAPGGTWRVTYKGTNHTFNVPDPQASSRLVIPYPTVSLSGDVVQSVSWVYRDANTGATLSGPPSYMTDNELRFDGVSGGRIYESPNRDPATTSHVLSSTVNWSNVRQLSFAYDDSLGNHYVILFSKP